MEIFLPKKIKRAIERLGASGFEAYAVGGCVRDALLGKVPKDYDITTSARPEQVKECFSDCAVIETGIKHGTVTVVLEGENIEMTTYRADGKYSDRRRPDGVSFSDRIEDDLARRDFTVNAMAYSPNRGLVDLFGGREDLEGKIIRCVGKPAKRFDEDALRIMRALRFSSALGFEIEKQTAEAVHQMRELLKEISAERLSHELQLLLCGEPYGVLRSFAEVFAVFIPEIAPCIGFEQHNKYHVYDVWGHIAAAVKNSVPDPDVRLALFLHDVGKPRCYTVDEKGQGHFHGHEKISAEMAEEILTRLRFPNSTVRRVTTLIRYHYVTPNDSDRAVKRLLSKVGEEDFFLLAEVMKADNSAKQPFCKERVRTVEAMISRAERIIAEKNCVSLAALAVDGNDMLALGLRGKEIGDALNRLLEAVIDETVPNEREALLQFIIHNS